MPVHKFGTSTLHSLLDLCFPPICVSCSTQGSWFCSACITSASDNTIKRCHVCDDYSPYGRTCAECKRVTRLDGLVAAGPYHHKALRAAIHALKFDGVTSLADTLGALLAHPVAKSLASLETDTDDTLIVPIPLHIRRERMRGYNQATLLANALSRGLSLPSIPILQRIRSTSPQTSILHDMPQARRKNLNGAFAVNRQIPLPVPSRVLLVDDVATSCASLEAAAKVLYDLGVHSVWGAVVCKG